MITLYSTHCPKCNVLTQKLTAKGIKFDVVDDIVEMRKKGFLSAPMLEVDGELMDFSEAVTWVNSKET